MGTGVVGAHGVHVLTNVAPSQNKQESVTVLNQVMEVKPVVGTLLRWKNVPNAMVLILHQFKDNK